MEHFSLQFKETRNPWNLNCKKTNLLPEAKYAPMNLESDLALKTSATLQSVRGLSSV